MTSYDEIGTTYTVTRRPDPRIGALIEAALADARSVINVGAGAGSYEPTQTVLAVEPSPVMIRQRPAGSATVVQAHQLADWLGGARIEPVPIPHDCTLTAEQ